MRIEGYIEHPNMKITVFQMDGKYAVKFETGLYEQTFKMRSGAGIENLEDVKKWATEEIQNKVLEQFNRMHQIFLDGMQNIQPEEEEEFDVII